jgi:hypothetical protein
MESPSKPKSWLSRNWKWLVPVVGLGALLACVACVALLATAVFGTIKSSEPYQEAMAAVREHPEAVEALGTPIRAGFFVGGSVQVSGPTGSADLSIPVSGPQGSGTLYVMGVKTLGTWQLLNLELAVEGSETRLDLLAPH